MKEKKNIGKLFDRIASRYDFLNHLFSLNIDRYWRRKAIREMLRSAGKVSEVLDVAIGTADLSIELLHQSPAVHITGIDLSDEMIRRGKQKAEKRRLADKIDFVKASALEMPYADNSFDVVMCAYGVRNFSDLERGLSEMQRVLRSGGQLLILEFSYPENKLVAWAYDLYFSHVMPFVGRLVSRDKTAYSYFYQSVKNFVWGEQMTPYLKKAGFNHISFTTLTFGISTAYFARKD